MALFLFASFRSDFFQKFLGFLVTLFRVEFYRQLTLR